MRVGLCLVAIAAGLLLRVLLVGEHTHPRGDVVLDVGVARALSQGEGYGADFRRGTAFVVGDAAPGPQDRADQHPPLWPTLGWALSPLLRSPFSALQLASLLAGLATIALAWRVAERMTEGIVGCPDGVGPLAGALVALSFVAVDASGSGSLYGAQALGVLLLVEWLSKARVPVLGAGVLLGALCLLNHQCLVLVPVPVCVLVLGAPRGQRGAALLRALGILAVAAACQVPWWWRNHLVFGNAFYSVNSLYLLWRAGFAPEVGLEQGLPLARFADVSVVSALAAGLGGWLKANLLYLLFAGIVVWPGLLGLVLTGGPALVVSAVARRDRRTLACLLCLGALGAVTILWPFTKLRYLVSLVPLVTVLGVRVLAARPGRLEKGAAWGLLVGWLGVVLATRGDVMGTEDFAQPYRWLVVAVGGATVLMIPLALRHLRVASDGMRFALVAGLAPTASVAFLAFLFVGSETLPSTTYHAAWFLPDIYGQDKEYREEREARLLARVAGDLRQRGIQRVIGPVGLLEHEWQRLISLPMPGDHGWTALDALLSDAEEDVEHVVVAVEDGWHEPLDVGQSWLGGRLELLALFESDDGERHASLSRVRR